MFSSRGWACWCSSVRGVRGCGVAKRLFALITHPTMMWMTMGRRGVVLFKSFGFPRFDSLCSPLTIHIPYVVGNSLCSTHLQPTYATAPVVEYLYVFTLGLSVHICVYQEYAKLVFVSRFVSIGRSVESFTDLQMPTGQVLHLNKPSCLSCEVSWAGIRLGPRFSPPRLNPCVPSTLYERLIVVFPFVVASRFKNNMLQNVI